MPTILDKLADLSSVATGFNPAVSAGLTSFALLGKTLAASCANLANPSAPLVQTTGSVASAFPIGAQSGITFPSTANVGAICNFLTLPDAPSSGTGSETIYVVTAINPTNYSLFRAHVFGAGDNTPPDIYLTYDTGSPSFGVAVSTITSAGTSSGVFAGVRAPGSTGSVTADTVTQAALAVPNLIAVKIDMVNMVLTMQNLSQPTWVKASTAIPAGATRPAIATNYEMTGLVSQSNMALTNHAWLHYNRATTTAEDALVYAQLKKIMATRGVTI